MEKLVNHLKEKEESTEEKERDNTSTDSVVAIYDLQAVWQLPRENTSVFYYKSKLNNFNFTISELGSDQNDCYFWHEGEARRGAEEIGSCVFKYIQSKIETYTGPGLEFIFYLDNYCGQNKNQFMLSMYSYCLIKYPNIKSITHKFLIRGHTQNERDSVHATIEKPIQRRVKSGNIYAPSQYA